MNPIAIFQHAVHEGPGFLAEFLTQRQLPFEIVYTEKIHQLPLAVNNYSGVVLMGGPMSVNDDLPWIAPLLALIREAVDLDIPVLGHCLGGQLMSKALGGKITKNPLKEIGWGPVTVHKGEVANFWFGEVEAFNGFHWHGETFSLPEGATHLLSTAYCQQQGFAVGKHLAFQCHIEMTAEMIKTWCEIGAEELREASSSAAVQQANEMQENVALHCFFLNKLASQVYSQWVKGLVK